MKEGIWGDFTIMRYLSQLVKRPIYIWTILEQPIVTKKIEYPIENKISNPSEDLNIVYSYNHYYPMISITGYQNIPLSPLPLHINTTLTSRPNHGFDPGSIFKPSFKKN